MPVEIPRPHTKRRRSFGPPVMGELESRTMFSTVKVVHIGPKQAIKSIDSAPWPRQGNNTPVKFVVDYSSTPYKLSHHSVYGNVTIAAADPSHKPTFKLPANDSTTLYVYGTLNISDIKTAG